MPGGTPEVVVSGMPLTGDHPTHPFVIDAKGQMFVDVGSATNACQGKNRVALSPGLNPCAEKETRAGTWLFSADKTGQVFSPSARYISGLRNSGQWLWGDGGLPAITATIENGVPKPRQHQGLMPPLGGSPLTKQDVAAVAAYVWVLGHSGAH